eukprot:3895344-Prymnesium_polylepis.1
MARPSGAAAPRGRGAGGEVLRERIAPGSLLDNDELYEAAGDAMHSANLRIVTECLHRSGLWRVRMSSMSVVESVIHGTSGGPPRPGEFSLRVTADGELPRIGALTRLSRQQANYAQILINDLHKVSRAKDLAHEHEVAAA